MNVTTWADFLKAMAAKGITKETLIDFKESELENSFKVDLEIHPHLSKLALQGDFFTHIVIDKNLPPGTARFDDQIIPWPPKPGSFTVPNCPPEALPQWNFMTYPNFHPSVQDQMNRPIYSGARLHVDKTFGDSTALAALRGCDLTKYHPEDPTYTFGKEWALKELQEESETHPIVPGKPRGSGGYINFYYCRVPNPCGEIDTKGRDMDKIGRFMHPGWKHDDRTLDLLNAIKQPTCTCLQTLYTPNEPVPEDRYRVLVKGPDGMFASMWTLDYTCKENGTEHHLHQPTLEFPIKTVERTHYAEKLLGLYRKAWR